MAEDARSHVCGSTAFSGFPASALERSIGDRFAEQVERHRDCVAVVDGELRLTYGELDAWANGVAHALSDGREPVAVVVGQGAGYAVAVLAALKCGRPYVPLEPTDPAARLRAFAAECGATVVLGDRVQARRVADAFPDTAVVIVDDVEPDVRPPDVAVRPDDVAYVFFTSGSTGAPKGVYDTHRNVLHNVLRYTRALGIAPGDGLTLLQGPAFSGCVSSQLGALLNGATSYPFRLGDEGLLRAAEWLEREPITIYHSVPSIFRAIASVGRDFERVRVVRLEGDRATSEDVDLWKAHFSPRSLLANGLGTTETGLACQLIVRHEDAVANGALPVGYPMAGVAIELVDDQRRPVAPGEIGEIAVTSDHLALGYWGRPDLTAERFDDSAGARRYFTGDLGRFAGDGCLEYLGRREGDLKVLGMRVEPAEIERALLRVDGVRQAAVAIREGDRGDGQVVAYVVPSGAATVGLRPVRAALAAVLPSAMLPTALVAIDELPLGANGKVDRAALPEPIVGHDGDGPASGAECWLARVWGDALSVEHVGVDDDFFELGGDSLAAAQILARVELETGRALPPGALVRAPTVRRFADVLAESGSGGSSRLTTLRAGDERPPLVLLHGNTGNTVHYAALVRATSDDRPLWGLEYPEPGADVAVDAIVDAHLASLTEARPDGPYLLAGFCYGGAIAHELARRLAADGAEAHVALLGITPFELPTVVAADSYRRWRHEYGPRPPALDRVRYHVGVAARGPLRELPGYLALRARNLARRAVARSGEDRSSTTPAARAAQEALASHRPKPFPGRPLVVLHRDDTDRYSSDPERDWDALGTAGIELVVVPGSTHSMLEGGGARALAGVLAAWAASVTRLV